MELPGYLTIPRHNGTRALRASMHALHAHLEELGITPQKQSFTLRPYFMELLGLWLALGGVLLPVAALAGPGWGGLLVGLLIPFVPLLELGFLVPTFTALVRQPACNLAATFPARQPALDVILCAHVDTKTELLDHHQRRVLLRLGLPSMALAVLAGILILVGQLARPVPASSVIRWTAFAVSLPLSACGLFTAANLTLGRLSRRPSTGAVDNGAAAAVLVGIADRLNSEAPQLSHISVTLLWTVGEEAQMQGALAWVRSRPEWPFPTLAVNLEILGQNGSYVLWEHDGTALRRTSNSSALNAAIENAVLSVTGERPIRAPQINSDAYAFHRRKVPATTLGTLDREMRDRGLHSHRDNPSRIEPSRLDEAQAILMHFLRNRPEEQA